MHHSITDGIDTRKVTSGGEQPDTRQGFLGSISRLDVVSTILPVTDLWTCRMVDLITCEDLPSGGISDTPPVVYLKHPQYGIY